MKVLFISLGCDKNLVDSEHMSGILEKAGYQFTDDEREADIIVINSCCLLMMHRKIALTPFLKWQDTRKKEIVRH